VRYTSSVRTGKRGSRARAARTDAERLAWALRFAQADLAAWRDGDWFNALEDAEDLAAGAGPATSWAIPMKGSVERMKAALTPLQEALRRFFERIDRVRQRALAARGTEAQGYGEPVRLKFSGTANFYVGSTGRGLRVQFESSEESPGKVFVTGMLLGVADLLSRVDLSRLRRCPDCNRLFLAMRHQRFDTPQCSLRDRVRRFRTKVARKTWSRCAPALELARDELLALLDPRNWTSFTGAW
jgi:hypothetical protein